MPQAQARARGGHRPSQETEVPPPPQNGEAKKASKTAKDFIDEIDEILEEAAVAANFRQKGGE